MKRDEKVERFGYKVDDVKKVSIAHFLESIGHKLEQRGNHHMTNSPLSDDTNPSFRIYPENTFYDFSTGIGGSIIDLFINLYGVNIAEAIELLGGQAELPKVEPKKKLTKVAERKFDIEMYLSKNRFEIKEVMHYAMERGLMFVECNAGNYFVYDGKDWSANLSLMFYHRDEYGNICGAKFRNVREQDKGDQKCEGRWSSRGKLYYYVLEHITNVFVEPVILLTESETSSNSLYAYLRSIGRTNFVILCFGGVTTSNKSLPIKYSWCRNRYVLIDYDGDEKSYNKRIKGLEHFKAKDIKLELPKGEDINSLWVDGKLGDYESLFRQIF
jgi:hypothetical protein